MNDLSPKRYGLITGSEVHILHPKKNNEKTQISYAKKLAKHAVFKYMDDVNTWQTEHGHMGESMASEWYQTYVDKIGEKPDFIKNGEFGGSADWLADGYGVDFKCPTTLGKWLDYLTDGIDNQQYHQCQMYMALYGVKEWRICAYLAETVFMNDNGETYPIEEKERGVLIKIDQDPNWFNETVEKSKFVLEQRNRFIEIYSQKKLD